MNVFWRDELGQIYMRKPFETISRSSYRASVLASGGAVSEIGECGTDMLACYACDDCLEALPVGDPAKGERE